MNRWNLGFGISWRWLNIGLVFLRPKEIFHRPVSTDPPNLWFEYNVFLGIPFFYFIFTWRRGDLEQRKTFNPDSLHSADPV